MKEKNKKVQSAEIWTNHRRADDVTPSCAWLVSGEINFIFMTNFYVAAKLSLVQYSSLVVVCEIKGTLNSFEMQSWKGFHCKSCDNFSKKGEL